MKPDINGWHLFKEVVKVLSTTEGKREAIEFFTDSHELNKEKAHVFFKSKEFLNLLSKVKVWMISCSQYEISSDDFYWVESRNYPITSNDFHKITSTLEIVFFENAVDTTKELGYPSWYIIYKEWKYSWVMGQGSTEVLFLDIEKHRDLLLDKII